MPKAIADVFGALRVGLFCTLIVFCLGAVFGGQQPVQQFQPCPQNQQEDDKRFLGETFRERLTTDPVAFFTLWLTVFTAVLAASTIGLWVVTYKASIAQARDMDKSINAAKDSADAAKKSADVAERSLHELNRAFVFVKDVKSAASATVGAVDIWITWENTGTTQTKSMRTLTMSGRFDPAIPDDFDYRDIGEPGAASLGPKGSLSVEPITLSAAVLSDLVAERCQYLVWGWAEYDDRFPGTERHRTEYAARLKVSSPDGGKSFVVVPIARRNYNGSDEECGQRFKRAQQIRPRIADADIIETPDTLIATVAAEPPPKPKT